MRQQAASLYVFAGTRPGVAAEVVLNEIESVLRTVRQRIPDLETDVQIFFSEPGPRVPDDNPIVTGMVAAHKNIFGKPPVSAVVPWHSDASPLFRSGIATVNYGPPGEVSPINGEGVKTQDLFDCARIYADLNVRVCGDVLRLHDCGRSMQLNAPDWPQAFCQFIVLGASVIAISQYVSLFPCKTTL